MKDLETIRICVKIKYVHIYKNNVCKWYTQAILEDAQSASSSIDFFFSIEEKYNKP